MIVDDGGIKLAQVSFGRRDSTELFVGLTDCHRRPPVPDNWRGLPGRRLLLRGFHEGEALQRRAGPACERHDGEGCEADLRDFA